MLFSCKDLVYVKAKITVFLITTIVRRCSKLSMKMEFESVVFTVTRMVAKEGISTSFTSGRHLTSVESKLEIVL